MLFVEFRFLWFYALVFAVHWGLGANVARKRWLLACSYVFYAAWDWRFCSLLAAATVANFLVAQRIENAADPVARRRWLGLIVAVNLGVLGFFKYCDFFLGSVGSLLGFLGLPLSAGGRMTLGIVLPVGISFFTFQFLSYTVDVYRGRLAATRVLADLALAVSFFPQLVAGPITRAADLLPQLALTRRFAEVEFRGCVTLFLLGFFKKACVSDQLAPLVDRFWASPGDFHAAGAWLAAVGYAAQIYCDFSGYTDMAIACGGGLGYRLAWNFAHPYFAADIADFWRRWHISLSTWLRDYLYIPLGGNRGGHVFVARNLLLTMLLGGLWHGAAWNFVLWGGLHGVALIVHREWKARGGGVSLPAALGTTLTFYWVCVCWVFFRAPDLPTAWTALKPLLFLPTHGTAALPHETVAWAALLGLALAHAASWRRTLAGTWERLPDWAFAGACGLAIGVMLPFLPTQYRPFIYFQF